jgi:hypothetical protein
MTLATGTRTALACTGLVLGILATVLANVAYGAHYGIVGGVVSAWPAAAFLVSSEILVGMLRARPAVPATVTEAVSPDVTKAVPRVAPVDVPASTVPPRREARSRTVAARPAPTRIDAKRKPDPAKAFAAELAAGQLPSLREIKTRARCGTPRARVILAELAELSVPHAA